MLSRYTFRIVGGLALIIAGCSGDTSTTNSSAPVAPTGPSAAGKALLLDSQPDGAKEVLAARNDAKDDEEIVVVGRIGGGTDPWVQGMAAFSIVDNSLKACSDIPGDKCPTPWDYCCEADLPKARTLVKLVGADGNVIGTDARELLGVHELQTVYVQGRARRDAEGNLSVLASRIYVAPGGAAPVISGEAGEQPHAHDHDHAEPVATPSEPSKE